MPKCQIKEYDVNEVVPGLWLGNCNSAYNHEFLNQYNIKYVISIIDKFDERFRYNNINYMIIPVKDTAICQLDMIPLFDTTSNLIKHALKKNKGVLVHCKNGHHRSATLVAAYLIRDLNMSYESSIAYIKTLRPCALRDRKCILEWLKRYYITLQKY